LLPPLHPISINTVDKIAWRPVSLKQLTMRKMKTELLIVEPSAICSKVKTLVKEILILSEKRLLVWLTKYKQLGRQLIQESVCLGCDCWKM
jgi:hypothetical protein